MKHNVTKAPNTIHGPLGLKYYPLKKTKVISNGSGRQIYTTYAV
jgi:hypothetical protein